ncbi:MAG TPA: AI-2E family transporter [Acidimicrobiales bacterium]|nr:AI-2E family transporter [Acidimicrobiales bacterium]
MSDGQRSYPGAVLRVAAEYSWRLLLVGALIYFSVRLLSMLHVVVIPFLVALLVTALLQPLSARLRRWGLPRGPATLLTMLVAVVVLGGLITLVVVRAAEEAPQLGNEINNLLPHVKHWLVTGPLKLNPTTVDNLQKTISHDITKNSSAIASTALSTGKTVATLLSGLVLAVFCIIFLVYDGDRIWAFLLKGVPPAGRKVADASGRAAWNTISYYVRGTLTVATFHGVVITITLTLLHVPLAFPIGVLVGLGSFIPLIGAVITGILAVAVAGLSQGLVAALIVVGVLLLDSQIEGHLLQPFVVGRYVRIHALAIVLSLAAGAILFGIVGAFVAVPVVATLNSAVRAALAVQRGTPVAAAEPPPPPPATAADPLVSGGNGDGAGPGTEPHDTTHERTRPSGP